MYGACTRGEESHTVSYAKVEKINRISNTELNEFNNIVREYLPGTSESELYEKFNNSNNVFIGYYLENKLIGVCFGESIDKEHFGLIGIAIIFPYNKQGRGSKLLNYFENIVKSKGYRNISLGSGDGYVERFYIKNGYVLSSLKILVENDIWKEKNNELFPISRIERQGKYIKLVIENICYETADKDKICKFYGGFERFYVFEKNIL